MASSIPAQTSLVIGPNASLSGRHAVWVLLWVGAVSLGIALYLAIRGFWPVLPWAGLEMLAFGLALWVSVRRNAYREVLRFDHERLKVELGMVGRGVQSMCDLPRGSTRALLEPGATAHEGKRLLLSSGAQRIEIGRCLTDEEKEALQKRLKELLRPGWERIPAEAAGKSPVET